MSSPKAVVLLSGGLDSCTVAACARREGFDIHALSFDYGQRHSTELESARRVARSLGASRHEIVTIDLRAFGGSALTDEIEVPQGDVPTSADEIPVTYVPARNTIFLSFALAWAEVIEAFDIFLGVNALDYSGYPDCRPEYIAAYQEMANFATKAATQDQRKLKIHTPLIDLSKAEIIRLGLELGVDYGLTSSCYAPCDDGAPCGRCDSCHIRMAGFSAVGAEDPLSYPEPQT